LELLELVPVKLQWVVGLRTYLAGKTQVAKTIAVNHFAPLYVLPQADMAKLGWRSLLVFLNWHLAQ
jgi:hypothetical protein